MARVLHAERTLESRKGERFWPLLDTLSTLLPVCVGGSFCRDRARPGAWSAGESQAAWRGADLPDLRPEGSARTRGGGCGMKLCVSSCCLPYLALSPKIWSQNSTLDAPPQGHLGRPGASHKGLPRWQGTSLTAPEKMAAPELSTQGLFLPPWTLDAIANDLESHLHLFLGDFGLIRRTGRSRTIGKDRGRCGIFPTLSVILKETKHTKTPLVWTGCRELGLPVEPPEEVGFGEPGVPGSPETGLRLPPPPRALSQTPLRHGGRGRVGALPAAADPRAPGAPPPGCLGPVRLCAAAAAAAPPHPGRDPRTGKPESWLPAGPGPRRPAIPRPERRTAPFSPFLPPRDGSPRARRKPGSSQRPPSGRTTPAPAGSLQRDAAKEHYINTLGPDLDTEDSCFKKIQSSLKSCNLYAF
ncbi:collagen alpha-1(I) chain-like [Pseudorca crassidens]|uniref:collagen alpha-1(I) chain-like n=1 Tax=Pseudorca crassidens TaxID=82174 RepID=UPI00352E54EC